MLYIKNNKYILYTFINNHIHLNKYKEYTKNKLIME